MIVNISLFSMLRVIAGVNQVELELPDDCPVRELKTILLDKYPQLKMGMESAIVAIDHSQSDDDSVIKPGMDISIIPPVAGG